jgi:hypothetical protein
VVVETTKAGGCPVGVVAAVGMEVPMEDVMLSRREGLEQQGRKEMVKGMGTIPMYSEMGYFGQVLLTPTLMGAGTEITTYLVAMAVVILGEIMVDTIIKDSTMATIMDGMMLIVILIIWVVCRPENNSWLRRRQRLLLGNLWIVQASGRQWIHPI